MAATPQAVVDTRYCTAHATAFTVTKTLWNDFAVKDERGTAVMRIESVAFSFLNRYRLVDVSASTRRRVLTVERSPSLFDIGRTWQAYRGDSTSRTDLLFVAVRRPSLFTWADIGVHLAGRGEREPDFVVTTQGFSRREFTISRAGAAVAQIRRKVLFNNGYNVSVTAGVDHAFILALTAILEDIRRDDVRRKET